MASIPDNTKRFVLTSVPSLPHLEAALPVRKHVPRECTGAEGALALCLGERLARELLEWLCAAGWIEAINRVDMALTRTWNEDASPVHYIVRLLSYRLIPVAIRDKNRSGRSQAARR